MIISAEWLKTTSRQGLGAGAFAALRATGGSVFDDPRYRHSSIIIARRNFGCGSSREHAVWALLDIGVRAVIANSFSDIFAGNAFKNGLLTIALSEDSISNLLENGKGNSINIDLNCQLVTVATGERLSFEFDPFRKQCLLDGMDEISLSEKESGTITRFETERAKNRPFFGPPKSDRI
jgi:3-isopropylmalate/(R)-2-methylmalate dehydratase small subunit